MDNKDRATAENAVRRCNPSEAGDILAIINAAAEAYKGVIPADRWHEPYMTAEELASELADGVMFSCYVAHDRLVGVMGLQRRSNVDLIRHAYVLPDWQRRGIASRLLADLCEGPEWPILIGTWKDADWAIRFYEQHGFARVGDGDIGPLLRTYWSVPERQIVTSVVLALPPLSGEAAGRLIADVTPPASFQ